MDADQWRQVLEVFSDAVERSPGERDRLLQAALGGDRELEAEVRSLIASHEEDPEFLENPAASLAGPEPGSPEVEDPARIGPYRVIERIGVGGMGRVYLAERDDDQFHRRVAIKLVKRGMDSEQILARFRAERQILASLEHPGIARLYDGGLADDGRPYFVLEYIAGGLPIDRYCEQNGLSVRARLDLFCRACDAVQYAHRKLIVHRDLKPSNLLVSKSGEIKLLDFGIAKLLDPGAANMTSFAPTQTQMRLLTPEYASPEQVRGEPLSTTSDVYALGALLFRILTGESPYRIETASAAELTQAICDQEPDKPSTVVRRGNSRTAQSGAREETLLSRQLHGDLDNIVMMALRKEPESRYPSADALAADIRRHLEHRPVLARPHTTGYRIKRFVQRHRVAVALSSLAVLFLVGGVAGTLWQARTARLERDRARTEARKAEKVAEVLADFFSVSNPGENADAGTMTVREFADHAEERVLEELADEPEIRSRLQTIMADMNVDLARYDRSRQLLESALAVQRQLYPNGHPDLAITLRGLGAVLTFQQESERARQALEEAVAMQRRLLGSSLELATTLAALAQIRGAEQDFEGAEQAILEAIEIRSRLLSSDHPLVGESFGWMAVLHWVKGDFAPAIAFGERAVSILRKAHGDIHQSVAHELNNLGAFYYGNGDYTQARQTHREALRVRTAVYGPEHPYVAYSLTHLGNLSTLLGEPETAIPPLRRALEIREAAYGNDHALVGASLMYLGVGLAEGGDLDQAEELLQQAASIQRSAHAGEHADLAEVLFERGNVRCARGRCEEAVDFYREATRIRRQALGSDHPKTAAAETALARSLIARGELGEAEELLDSARVAFGTRLSADHLDAAALHLVRGDLERQRGDLPEARASYERAIEILRASLPAEHRRVAEAATRLAEVVELGALGAATP